MCKVYHTDKQTFVDMQVRAMNTNSELASVKAQEASLQRKIKLSEATEQELIESTGNDGKARVWQGIGKMFLAVTVDDQTKQLRKERAEYADQISALGKKKIYLETTYNNLTNALADFTMKK